jgi:hypothetical protein
MAAGDERDDGQADGLGLSPNDGLDRRLEQLDFLGRGGGDQVGFALGGLQSSHVNSSDEVTSGSFYMLGSGIARRKCGGVPVSSGEPASYQWRVKAPCSKIRPGSNRIAKVDSHGFGNHLPFGSFI